MNTSELADPAVFARCYQERSVSRREKIDRIRMEKDRRLSLAAGILLDRGLQAYGIREADVRIDTGTYGKPYLPEFPDIHFSLSHSNEMAMAVFSEKEVGCDIEYRKQFNEKLARRFFCPQEYAWMMKGEDISERTERFYRLWTLKESFLKASGRGLSQSLDSFCFFMGAAVTVRPQTEGARYEFEEHSFGDYSAAICLIIDHG